MINIEGKFEIEKSTISSSGNPMDANNYQVNPLYNKHAGSGGFLAINAKSALIKRDVLFQATGGSATYGISSQY